MIPPEIVKGIAAEMVWSLGGKKITPVKNIDAAIKNRIVVVMQ